MKRLFFLQKKNEALIKNLGKKDVIIYLDNLSSEENQKKHHTIGYYIKKLEDKTIQFRYCYEMRWAQAWAFKKRNKNDNKSFAQELVFQGKSLWYPMEFILHYDVDYLSHECPLSKILLYIDCINMIIKEKKPSQVVIENEKTSFNRVVAKICRKERIRITNLKLKAQKKSFLFRIVNNPLLIRNYVKSRILIRVLVAKVFCKQTKPEKILISTSDRLSYKENRNDVFWGPIIKVMEKQSIPYKMVEYDRIETLDGFKNLKERYMPQKYDAQFIGTYYTLNTLKDIKTMVGFLKKKFKEMDKKGFKESFEYQGVSFYDLIRSRLKKIFLTYAWYIADVYAITKAVIEKEKPQVVLVDHEKNYYGRALISEANFRNIPSLCFEGEQIFDNYMYLTQIPIKEILNKKSPLWRPITNKKFLWGEYTREWYQKKNYFPKQNLKIIGAPKYDFLKSLGKKNLQEIRRKYKAKKEERLITVITRAKPWENEYLSMIFKSLRDIKNLNIIVKMHPRDPILNKKTIEKIIKRFNINARVSRYENSSRLIHASDLVITYSSTLVYECITLNKKLVLVGLGTDPTHTYIREGFIKPYKDLSEVRKGVRACLFKNKGMNASLRKKFIRKYLYSDDGKASERAVAEIKKFL
ncbi:hypothetical protein AYK26_02230 [Euryarchaeota archaeon SM23-78]|nr:MAG: hypothetical protein AYK26_02230 [Euryarchaeota archaeon SM23-78]MBW3000901.1 UDP-N-acetylglucosamine 2-epimerase [Candidatus Woesearchaeota archaeon]